MASARIVVVDDDSDFVAFMDDALSGEGYDVLTATTRDAGFDLIRDQRPDVIVLDVRMDSSRSGEVLIDLLQAHLPSRNIPTIVCTADRPFLRNQGERLTTKGFMLLEKPFNLDDLFVLIERALD